MNLMLDTANERPSAAKGADDLSPAWHCLVLTLIGLAAIAISIVLPRDEKASPPSSRPIASPATTRVSPATAPIALPADGFAALFPSPQGDTHAPQPDF